MLALLRLAVMGFFFGLFGVLAFFTLRFLLRTVLPLGEELPATLAARLHPLFPVRKAGGLPRRILTFFLDLSLSLAAFCAVILFLFWHADGEVRAFSLLSLFLGGLLAHRLYRRFFVLLEARLVFYVKFFLLRLIRPPLALLLRCGVFFLAFLNKILFVFIKNVKRYDTLLVSCIYLRRAARITAGRRVRREILLAIRTREG